jgi:hypothetical protein
MSSKPAEMKRLINWWEAVSWGFPVGRSCRVSFLPTIVGFQLLDSGYYGRRGRHSTATDGQLQGVRRVS